VSAAEHEGAERVWAEAPGNGRRLLVNVSARTRQRQWPVERFVGALDRLRTVAPGLRILVIAPPDEFDRARAVARGADAVAAKPLLRETFALVAASDMVFTPDTSIAHVASAFATPTVAMFVPGWSGFTPYRTPGRYICADGPTLDSLPVEPVAAALELVYAAGRGLEPECVPFSAAPRARAISR
jgi:ADP-heptose:LPS heptosyltransferase